MRMTSKNQTTFFLSRQQPASVRENECVGKLSKAKWHQLPIKVSRRSESIRPDLLFVCFL